MMMPEKYEIQARFTPALLCSAPFIAFGFYFLSGADKGFWSTLLAQAVAGVSMTFALYYLAAFVCRQIGKWLEDKMYGNGLNFPTTDYLIEGSILCSSERQDSIRYKIEQEFGIDLAAKKADTGANRRRINEAVAAVRRKFFKKSEIILQRNIQFGFAKNLAGGAILSFVASLLLGIISVASLNYTSATVSALLAVWYASLSAFGLMAMRSNAIRYAHTLFEEYLAD
jgi:hypothetical protein